MAFWDTHSERKAHLNDTSKLPSKTVGEHNLKWNITALQMVSYLWQLLSWIRALQPLLFFPSRTHLICPHPPQQQKPARSNLTDLHSGNFTLTLRVSRPDLMHNSNICITTDSFSPSIIPWWIFMIHHERWGEMRPLNESVYLHQMWYQGKLFSLCQFCYLGFLFYSKGLRKQNLSQYFWDQINM